MASSEGHIHWSGIGDETVDFLGQELRLTSEVSNATTVKVDPIGMTRIRLNSSVAAGLPIPTDGWRVIPETSPALEARVDGHYPTGYIRVRQV